MITDNLYILLTALMAIAFGVNLTVQLTKDLIPLPTKLWVILVSATLMLVSLFAASDFGYAEFNSHTALIAVAGSPVIAYVAMYGFDTVSELWKRFKNGGKIE